MSQGYPDPNPFESPRGPAGFGDYQPPRPRSKQSSSTKIVLIVLGIVGGGVVLLCCGGFAGMMMLGMSVIEAEVTAQLRDNEVLRENLGEIQSCKTNFAKSAAEDDDDTFVYDVVGSKGSGTLTVATDWDDNITYAKLRMSDGEEIVLVEE